MYCKLFSLFSIVFTFFLSNSSLSSPLCDFEKLPTRGPFQIICNYLDLESFKNLNLASKIILKKISDLNKITEEKNTEDGENLYKKFQDFLSTNTPDLSIHDKHESKESYSVFIQSYFEMFTLDKMKKSNISENDIEKYHHIQQGKPVRQQNILKFTRKSLYRKINNKIYNCFLENFNKRFQNYYVIMISSINLANKKISFLPPCISQFINLTHLYLHQNNLIFLPTEISLCKKLEYIHLGENELESLPLEISRWENIKHIILYSNNIRNFKEIHSIFKERKVDFLLDLNSDAFFSPEDKDEEDY